MIERGIRQRCIFSPDLFNQYSEAVLSEWEILPGFIIGRHNLNKRKYEDETVLIETQRKLQKLLQEAVKESKKKGLPINCKNKECMVVSKRNHPTCDLQIGDTKINQFTLFTSFRLLSPSLFPYPQCLGRCALQPSSGNIC